MCIFGILGISGLIALILVTFLKTSLHCMLTEMVCCAGYQMTGEVGLDPVLGIVGIAGLILGINQFILDFSSLCVARDGLLVIR